MSIEDNQFVHIKRCASAKEMWDRLQQVHERSNMNNKLYLKRKMHGMRLGKDDSMQEHINAMLEIVERLRGLGEDMKDDDVASLLLCSLPDSYGTLVIALEARPEAELTLDFVQGKLMDEFQRRQESVVHDIAVDSALKATVSKFQGKRETRSCFFCEMPGHVKKNCFKWKATLDKGHKAKSAVEESNEKDTCSNLKNSEDS